MKRLCLAAASVFFMTSVLPAVADGSCSDFKWSLAREQEWFKANHPSVASSGGFPGTQGAVTLRLAPSYTLSFVVPPDHKPASDSFGAVIALPQIEANGVYQITLSSEGWIDLVQAGKAVRSTAFSGVKGCPGLRKSVRFDLKAGAATLQVSGVKEPTIEAAFSWAE